MSDRYHVELQGSTLSHPLTATTSSPPAPTQTLSITLSPPIHSLLSPELLNNSSLFMYTLTLLNDLCLVLFITSLTGTPRSLLLVT